MITPQYKIKDKLEFTNGNGNTIIATVTKVYPTNIPNYKLESDDTPMPIYLSEPVLKRCLKNHSLLTG